MTVDPRAQELERLKAQLSRLQDEHAACAAAQEPPPAFLVKQLTELSAKVRDLEAQLSAPPHR